MLSVLIVDDERIIREGLKTIIDWTDYGFHICGEASNGEEGYERIIKQQPDIVIVDVKMPGMDGLKMIEKLNMEGFGGRIIILSGYSEFKYAQKSIELGVEMYILKPVEEEELIQKLNEIKKSLLDEKKRAESLNEAFVLSKDKAVENIITQKTDIATIRRYGNLYGFGFPWRSYQVILIQLVCDRVKLNKNKYKTFKLIKNYFKNEKSELVFSNGEYTGILLRHKYTQSTLHSLEELQNKIKKSLGIRNVIAVGNEVKSEDEIYYSYKQALEILAKKFHYGSMRVIIKEPVKKPYLNIDVLNNKGMAARTLINKIFIAVDVNNTEYINNLLEHVKCAFQVSDFSEENIKISYIRLYTELVKKLLTSNEDLFEIESDEEEIYNEIQQKSTLRELHGYIKYKLMAISDMLADTRPDGYMKKIIDYINRNYEKDLKLVNIAEIFNYNSAYLGKLFKNYTGKYFNTYVDHVRMNKAKMLLESGLKVYQVSVKVGYGDVDYFSCKFKKYFGYSPSSCRPH